MEAGRQIVEVEGTGRKPRRFVFVLLDNFTMLCFACASRRCASPTAWPAGALQLGIAGEGGETVRHLFGGHGVQARHGSRRARPRRHVLVCGGIDVQSATTKRVLNWLRREARRGAVTMGGLCTAGYTLAKAGLLDGKRATIHWENQDSFAEEFDEVELTKSVFVIDGNR
jgi:transcriptional regulator GlxA family with amidase domain